MIANRRPLLVLAAVVVVAAVAYVLTKPDPHERATSSSTTTTAAPPSTVPTTLAAGGVDFEAVGTYLVDAENDLFQNPNVDDVDKIMLSECACYESTRKNIQYLVDHEWHLNDDEVELRKIVVGYTDANRAELYISSQPTGSVVVDKNGTAMEDPPAGPLQPVSVQYSLKKSDDGNWRIAQRVKADTGAGTL